jgi:HSP20 family protein
MFWDRLNDKTENLTLEVELPDVESENIFLVTHENSVYLKAFSKTVEYVGSFFLMGQKIQKRLLQSIIKGCSLSKFPMGGFYVCKKFPN